MKRALANQSKTIHLPVHLVDKIGKMRRTVLRLQEELGREPTDEELAAGRVSANGNGQNLGRGFTGCAGRAVFDPRSRHARELNKKLAHEEGKLLVLVI